MIGVDTNVLARLFVTDNPQQHAAATRFFGERSPDDPAFVSAVVQAELVWLLERTMRYPVDRIVEVLNGMLESSDFVVEHRHLLERALKVRDRDKLNLADTVIAGIAGDAGCRTTVTFDKPAARHVPGMTLLK